MDLNLKGKKALVCGSTQGLGLASAIELALLGADVVLMARNESRLKDAIKTLDGSMGQQHGYIVADFQDPQEVKRSINEYISKKNVINILVNNTGGPKGGAAVDASPDEFLSAFHSHLICNQLLVQAVLPDMKDSGYGRIVNIISTSVKEPIAGLAVSNTIRGAVASWAKTLAGELGVFGITVNNVLPGMTRTARYDALKKGRAEQAQLSEEKIEANIIASIPLRRIGIAAEFGAAVAFLCSPAAAYITGINLPVDGGKLACL
jgi:3-oxoacyl-[acyl-carrier protein] reductase